MKQYAIPSKRGVQVVSVPEVTDMNPESFVAYLNDLLLGGKIDPGPKDTVISMRVSKPLLTSMKAAAAFQRLSLTDYILLLHRAAMAAGGAADKVKP